MTNFLKRMFLLTAIADHDDDKTTKINPSNDDNNPARFRRETTGHPITRDSRSTRDERNLSIRSSFGQVTDVSGKTYRLQIVVYI